MVQVVVSKVFGGEFVENSSFANLQNSIYYLVKQVLLNNGCEIDFEDVEGIKFVCSDGINIELILSKLRPFLNKMNVVVEVVGNKLQFVRDLGVVKIDDFEVPNKLILIELEVVD